MIDRTEAIIGTHIRIAVNSNDPKAASAVEAAFDEVRTIERRFSRFIDNNELSQLNASIGQWVRVAPDLHAILRYGKELENLTDGAFSLGVKGILESWGYNIRYELAREYARTEAVGYDLDDKGVCLRGPIEIGALGKWYALDLMRESLNAYGDIFLNAGGDIYARWENQDGPWTCYLENPFDPDEAIGEIILDGMFLASSSPIRRRWRNRHHLVDARIAEPANDMAATYVLGKTGLEADGLSTALFVSGYEQSKRLTQARNIEAVLLSPSRNVFRTAGFPGKLYSTN